MLTNIHGHIIGVGYNGVPAGLPHCIDNPCPGACLPSGQGLDECEATHAEANALLQCKDVQAIDTVYCTTAPCIGCVKLLLNTSAKRIIFVEAYPHTKPREMWERVGRDWVHMVDGREMGGKSVDERFPNIVALSEGRVSGQISEWPRLKTEVRDVVELLRNWK